MISCSRAQKEGKGQCSVLTCPLGTVFEPHCHSGGVGPGHRKVGWPKADWFYSQAASFI